MVREAMAETLFAASLAWTLMVLAPAAKVTLADHAVVPVAVLQLPPLSRQETVVTPILSAALPLSARLELLTLVPSAAGEVMATVGRVESRVMVREAMAETLFAASLD